jgi:outer membrane protein
MTRREFVPSLALVALLFGSLAAAFAAPAATGRPPRAALAVPARSVSDGSARPRMRPEMPALALAQVQAPRLARAQRTPFPLVTPSHRLTTAPRVALDPPVNPAPSFTPYPLVTLAPVGGPSSLPYPAYGTPVPGVNAGTNAPGIPQRVSLAQAITIGFASSPLLAAAQADVGVQAATVRLTRAGELPSLTGAANVSYSHSQLGYTVLPSGAIENVGTSNSLSASLSQLIFDGGKIAASVRAAQRSETALADTYRRQLQTVAFNVANAYYNYLAAQRTTQVDLEIVKEDQVQLDLVTAQAKAGTVPPVDVITANFPVAQARVAVVRAQGAELSAQAAFSNAMGLDADVNVQPIDDAPLFGTSSQISSLPIPTYDEAIKRGLAMRPDYDASLQQVESAKYSLKAAALGYVPSLVASGSYGDASTGIGGGALRNSGSVGAALSIPIFDQGTTAANVAQTKAQLRLQQANLKTELLGVQLNVKQSLTNLVSARASLDQTQAEYQSAIANLGSTSDQYKVGVTTLPLLLNAETALTQALTDSVTAVYNLRQAEQSYLYAVGTNDQQ